MCVKNPEFDADFESGDWTVRRGGWTLSSRNWTVRRGGWIESVLKKFLVEFLTKSYLFAQNVGISIFSTFSTVCKSSHPSTFFLLFQRIQI
jgi:hypothetical protein